MSTIWKHPDAREGQPVEGVFSVRHITFTNPSNGYAVVHLVPADSSAAVGFVAVGPFGEPRTGDCFRVQGIWRRDPRHGMQVEVSSVTPEVPRSLSAIERYLSGASIKGLGPHYAKQLVEYFGDQTYAVLQSGGARLEEVPGIGPVRAQTIRDSWAEHQGVHDLMVNLQGIAGLTPRQAQRLYRRYGREAWAVVSRYPYRLAEEVRGFGFRTCDRLAQTLGIAPDAPERIQAGLVHVLRTELESGHLWSSVAQVAQGAQELLGVQVDVHAEIDTLIEQGRVAAADAVDDEGTLRALYLPVVDATERHIAGRLAWLLRQSPAKGLGMARDEAERLVMRAAHADLSEEQRQAVVQLLGGARVAILTGGPGTGKTTTIRSLIACLQAIKLSYALCATTGRASKQLARSTGEPAATVHRHLGIGFGPQDEIAPVQETVLIIDESSMIDLWLMEEVLKRVTENTHLLLVGDVDQLPSVGPGAVLQDLISAAEQGVAGLHVSRLTRIFRQEAGNRSLIVANCHRVREGLRPLPPNSQSSDYYEMMRDTPEEARDLAVSLTTDRLAKFLRVPPSEVQVLAPMYGGAAGIRAINVALQQALNPPKPGVPELVLSSGEHQRILRVGDKVRQTRNDYTKGVLNGDLGFITAISLEERLLTVTFDERTVEYPFEDLDELVHAWAMTVHSAQGSQWPAVVIVMLTNHFVMLERNILYTALSRAERLAVLVSQERALRIAVRQGRATRRRTQLVPRLLQAMSAPLAELAQIPRTPPLFDWTTTGSAG